MRGAFFIVILIAMLIAGILTIKNMKSETSKGVNKTEAMQKAKNTAKIADEATKKLRETAKQANNPYSE